MVADAKENMAGQRRRGRPSAEASRQMMKELLLVAREVFAQKGYQAATMAEIAEKASLTKRTLYQWHGDKSGLFMASVVEGAERFPTISLDSTAAPEEALADYGLKLLREMGDERAYGIGLLFLRERDEFPEITPIVQRTHEKYVVQPLAKYLRGHGLEEEDSVARAELFVSMVAAPAHNRLLLGRPQINPEDAERHVELAVSCFLGRKGRK